MSRMDKIGCDTYNLIGNKTMPNVPSQTAIIYHTVLWDMIAKDKIVCYALQPLLC